MFEKILYFTLKTNLRSIVFWLAFIAGILLSGTTYIEGTTPPHAFHNVLAGCADVPMANAVPVLCSVVAGIDILRDRKNRFLDVCKCTGLKTRQYFIGKISAYMLLGFFAETAYAYLRLMIFLFKYNWLEGYAYTVSESVWLVFVRVVFFSLSSVPIYVAHSVCIALSTRSTTIGIVFSILFANLFYFLGTEYRLSYFGNYIYPVPLNILTYFTFYKTHAPEEMIVHIPISDVVISYIWGFFLFALLLAIGYLRLRRLNDK